VFICLKNKKKQKQKKTKKKQKKNFLFYDNSNILYKKMNIFMIFDCNQQTLRKKS